ncbi:MAG: hypothetical protein EWV89_02505 [Microcystis wesenbergii Mw_QC_B_20070930_S4]|nr:MAG: hypothetical protein EWV73_01975 [Microcystis wesenbergii Mw_QC_B_20070930_S4D]TRV17628.1 MAG: hypothetical protein EWV89_02505 [Microcystis wesenbergii Mw_QC_B_20070930_S4]
MSFQFTVHCLLDGYAVPLATLKKASPHTPHPTPYTLHPTPHTPHPTPYTPHPTPQFTPRCDSQILLKVSEIVAISVLPSQIILNIPPRRLTFE